MRSSQCSRLRPCRARRQPTPQVVILDRALNAQAPGHGAMRPQGAETQHLLAAPTNPLRKQPRIPGLQSREDVTSASATSTTTATT